MVPDGRLAMLATENANKEVGATEAGAPIAGDLDEATAGAANCGSGHRARCTGSRRPIYSSTNTTGGPAAKGSSALPLPATATTIGGTAKLYAFSAADAAARVLYAPTDNRQQIAMPKVSRDGAMVAFIARHHERLRFDGRGCIHACRSTAGRRPISRRRCAHRPPRWPGAATAICRRNCSPATRRNLRISARAANRPPREYCGAARSRSTIGRQTMPPRALGNHGRRTRVVHGGAGDRSRRHRPLARI